MKVGPPGCKRLPPVEVSGTPSKLIAPSLSSRRQMSPWMPPELTDCIIDCLSDSQPDLRACSLVCRQWLPSSIHHLFESVTVQPTLGFLTMLQAPSDPVRHHTQTLDFRIWPPRMDAITSQILEHLSHASRLRTIIFGPSPPSPLNFQALCQVSALSLQHSCFTSCTDFACFLSSFPALRELELKAVTWADARENGIPQIKLELESLTIQGLRGKSAILPWFSCPDLAPRTRTLCLSLPTKVDSAALSALSKYLRHLAGHLQYLQLDLYPSLHLDQTIALLELETLTSLRRLRISRGLYSDVPSLHSAAPTFRNFPPILDLGVRLAARNQLAELIFDVEMGTPVSLLLFESGLGLQNILASPGVAKIPRVVFVILRDRGTSEEVADVHHREGVAASMRKEFIWVGGREFSCSDDFRYLYGTLR
ncbi:hypothetical protein C8R47DRAFT_1289984 [Mycena vitilis]|nr:hypothetical protein C8R47DRAFT_1289984 [Mycena vitilis]